MRYKWRFVFSNGKFLDNFSKRGKERRFSRMIPKVKRRYAVKLHEIRFIPEDVKEEVKRYPVTDKLITEDRSLYGKRQDNGVVVIYSAFDLPELKLIRSNVLVLNAKKRRHDVVPVKWRVVCEKTKENVIIHLSGRTENNKEK